MCLESPGSADFQPSRDILSSVEEVDRLFEVQHYIKVDTDAPVKNIRSLFEPTPARIKHRKHLAREFGRDHVSTVMVDPYVLKGRALPDEVKALMREAGLGMEVAERPCANTTRREMYSQLAELVLEAPPTMEDAVAASRANSLLLEFWRSLPETGDVWKNQRPRWAKYLRSGTLEPLTGDGAI